MRLVALHTHLGANGNAPDSIGLLVESGNGAHSSEPDSPSRAECWRLLVVGVSGLDGDRLLGLDWVVRVQQKVELMPATHPFVLAEGDRDVGGLALVDDRGTHDWLGRSAALGGPDVHLLDEVSLVADVLHLAGYASAVFAPSGRSRASAGSS